MVKHKSDLFQYKARSNYPRVFGLRAFVCTMINLPHNKPLRDPEGASEALTDRERP